MKSKALNTVYTFTVAVVAAAALNLLCFAFIPFNILKKSYFNLVANLVTTLCNNNKFN